LRHSVVVHLVWFEGVRDPTALGRC